MISEWICLRPSSLKESSLIGRNLKFSNKLVDEGLVVGQRIPVEVISTVLEDHLGLRLNVRDVVLSLALRAHVVILSDEERHWDCLDLRNVDNVGVCGS